MKTILVYLVKMIILFLLSPAILLVWLGRLIGTEEIFRIFAQGLSILPGHFGSNFRVMYYWATCKKISPHVFISFGSFFSRKNIEVGEKTYIGAFCIIGSVCIGKEVLIASRVSIPSGRHQHGNHKNNESGHKDLHVETIKIGDKSWIGEGALVLADVGQNCIVGAGSVVVNPVPDNKVVVGNPARVVKER